MELGAPTITAETATKERPLFGAIPLIQIKDGNSVNLFQQLVLGLQLLRETDKEATLR